MEVSVRWFCTQPLHYTISWTLVNKSYTLGRNSILSLLKDGKIKQVIYSANVLGMMMMGALSASYVKIASPMTFKVTGGATIVLQDILDQIMKGLLPLAAVMAIYFFMVKKGPRYGIIIGTIVLVSLVTSFFGLL
ncbi:PTS system mannose/fructose/sorbose family transporter subunit IID [Enterococcus faecalis]